MRRQRRRRKVTIKRLLTWGGLILVAISIYFLISKFSGSSNDLDNYYNHFPYSSKNYIEHQYTPASSDFTVWAPKAEEVRLLLYSDGEKGHADQMFKMSLDNKTGLWSTSIKDNLVGKFYAFNAKYDGVWRGDSPGLLARAVGINGNRAAIIDFKDTNPINWNRDTIGIHSKLDEAVIYALHTRGFTIGLNSLDQDSLKGKYGGISADNSIEQFDKRVPVGFSHLKLLGITHVRLMPVMDFIHVDEKKSHIANSYSDGYSVFNYGVPEGSYSTDPINPKSRIIELKESIKNYHNSNIGVIIDVPLAINYQPSQTHFERLVPGYFFYSSDDKRTLYKDEDGYYPLALQRPFLKELIFQTLSWWVDEYHIDGFNLTNSSSLDESDYIDIVLRLKKKYPHLIILLDGIQDMAQLEGYEKGVLTKSRFYTLDSQQDSLSISAFLLGKSFDYSSWKGGIAGEFDDVDSTELRSTNVEVINRLSSNRGDTSSLANVFGYAKTRTEELSLGKLAFTMLLTSQGIPEINGGDEFLAKKNISNASIDEARKIEWNQLWQNTEFADYVSKLIRLRKSHPAFRMKSSEVNNHLEFIETSSSSVLAYRLKENANGDNWEDIVVIYNVSKTPAKVRLPEGRYIVVCRDGMVHEAGLNYVYSLASVAPQSAMVLYRSDKDMIAPPVVRKEPVKEKKSLDKDLLPKLELNINLAPALKDKERVVENLNQIKIDN